MKSIYDKNWILEVGIPIVKSYGGNLTIRALHYRLVSKGMTNDLKHYKKVVNAMTEARWSGDLDFPDFRDHERETLGETDFEITTPEDSAETAKLQIKAWARSYSKNTWENQPYYPEILIEKKALQGVFERPCRRYDVALNPCKGYPSLTFLYDMKCRFETALQAGKIPIILYFGDYDCSGENIPETIVNNLRRMGLEEIELRRIALLKEQVLEWNLPPAPTKETDSRGANWDGLGQVELDAVEPEKIAKMCEDAILSILDVDLRKELASQESAEFETFKEILLRDFKTLLD